MGVTKTEIFTETQNQIASVAKALAHPARIAILQHIFSKNTCICGDLVDEIGLAQATISQHLRELKKAEIIKGTISGTSVCYCINEVVWDDNRTLISNFLNTNTTFSSSCC